MDIPADKMLAWLILEDRGTFLDKVSRSPRMRTLKTQLPRMLPAAMSGRFEATALRPVASSGSDVTPAMRTIPSQSRLRPDFSEMMSP